MLVNRNYDICCIIAETKDVNDGYRGIWIAPT